MIERTEASSTAESSTAAHRRVFHSKVDTIRPTYGFEDVSLAPGTDTIEPFGMLPHGSLRLVGRKAGNV